MYCTSSHGTSFVEVVIVIGLVVLLIGMSVALSTTGRDSRRLWEAAVFLRAYIHQARFEAVTRGRAVGLAFEPGSTRAVFRPYVDGNGNGVRSRDIARGHDPPIDATIDLTARFPGVRFGVSGAVPAVGGGVTGGNPIRLGRSRILTVTPLGTATAGTIYLRNQPGHHAAVRTVGATGRVQTYRFSVTTGQWLRR